jgi:hypothetical protein
MLNTMQPESAEVAAEVEKALESARQACDSYKNSGLRFVSSLVASMRRGVQQLVDTREIEAAGAIEFVYTEDLTQDFLKNQPTFINISANFNKTKNSKTTTAVDFESGFQAICKRNPRIVVDLDASNVVDDMRKVSEALDVAKVSRGVWAAVHAYNQNPLETVIQATLPQLAVLDYARHVSHN